MTTKDFLRSLKPSLTWLKGHTMTFAQTIFQWLGQSKPTDWLTASVAIGALIVAWRTGLLDAKRAELSASTTLLKIEEKDLEKRKAVLEKQVGDVLAESDRAKQKMKEQIDELTRTAAEAQSLKKSLERMLVEKSQAEVQLEALNNMIKVREYSAGKITGINMGPRMHEFIKLVREMFDKGTFDEAKLRWCPTLPERPDE